MSIKEQLQQALSRISNFQGGDETITVQEGSQELVCQLTALDTLACAFTRLALRSDTLTSLSADALKATAEKLAARLTYLLEPISPIETDSQGCTVQMRSNPPQKDADRTSYYELLVSRTGEISLCRYSRAGGQPRGVIPAEVTREVLSRLAADFSAVAG